MLLEWLLGTKRRDPTEAAGTEPDGEASVAEYVDWLIGHMLRTSRTEMMLDTKHPLPGENETAPDKRPPCVPDREAVINKLKILSGLNPVRFSAAAQGRFQKTRGTYMLELDTRFQDDPERSICSIRLRIKA